MIATCPDCGKDYINKHDCPFFSNKVTTPVDPDGLCSCDKTQQALASIPLRPDGRCARCGGR
jgi:hypothetical protein